MSLINLVEGWDNLLAHINAMLKAIGDLLGQSSKRVTDRYEHLSREYLKREIIREGKNFYAEFQQNNGQLL